MARPGFRLGIYGFKDAEIVDFAAPYGVFCPRTHSWAAPIHPLNPTTQLGLLDGLPATTRKEPDRHESSPGGKVPIDRLAEIAPAARISRARVVDAGRMITAGGIASGMELGFHLLRRAGYDDDFVADIARIMEYSAAYELYRDDRVTATDLVASPAGSDRG
jgi:hypothetical protein